ncbi:MAG: ABC transporter substrate-binding protein [Deltaproteobacteria bacterium]|nr:ABC transporter substrate-binding protein [Deltaproteobacteria bacterium]
MKLRANAPSLDYSRFVLVLALTVVTGIVSELRAQSLIKVPFPYSPINASALPFFIAKDTKLYEKYGLDVDPVFVGASQLIIQSMLSGAANVAGFGGPAIVTNVLRGGDIITVAAMTPLTISLVAHPSIQRVEELKGKKVGISRLGGIPHFAIQLILDRYNMKDVTILQMGTQSEAEVGLRRGAIDAAVLSPPQLYLLQRDGFRELVGAQDYTKLGIKFLSGGIAARRSYAVKNRDVIARMIKATFEGVKVIFTQEALAKRILSKYTRQTNPEILDKLHKFATETIPRDPTIPREAIVNMSRLMGEFGIVEKAQVSATTPEAYFDNSYVDEVKQSGFFKELWK